MVVDNRFSKSENRLSTTPYCFRDSDYSVKAPNTAVNSLRSALPSAVFLEGDALATPSFSPAFFSTLGNGRSVCVKMQTSLSLWLLCGIWHLLFWGEHPLLLLLFALCAVLQAGWDTYPTSGWKPVHRGDNGFFSQITMQQCKEHPMASCKDAAVYHAERTACNVAIFIPASAMSTPFRFWRL